MKKAQEYIEELLDDNPICKECNKECITKCRLYNSYKSKLKRTSKDKLIIMSLNKPKTILECLN